ncbi:YdcF family protein [Planomicrobium sp. MB-3u-38]|uniref:YdcF family protein n=2 Tax=Planomicrobium TaxID=162291 RepID=UPI000C7D8D3E|nr:YdcF family protein [Planomicrobium sp. MB-3u-38]PKH09266.1 YdcF family protein [Planomicrobium sp. MB-3u-38]
MNQRKKDELELLTKLPVKIVIAALILLVGFSGTAAYDIWTYAKTSELVKADAAIVLGTAVWGDEPSPVLRERINHSIWLYENDYVDKIIFTGGKTNGSELAEAVVSKNYAIAHNVPEEDIYIEDRSMVTIENFRFVAEIAELHELTDFLVVSDPLHMKRALQMAEDTGFEAFTSPTTTSEYNSLTTIVPFFFREVGAYMAYSLSIGD